MKALTLKQLRYFEALAQQGHFGRAAEVCSVSQPALSVQIRDLENHLQAALFERSPKQVRLTAFGTAFAVRVREILRAVDELGDLARAAQQGLVGNLRLGVIPTVAPYLMPQVIAHLAQAFPGVDIQLRETITPRLLDELSNGVLDAAIIALPSGDPALTEVPLFAEEMVLVRHRDQATTPMPDRDALRQMRLLLLEEGHCFRDQALSFCDLGQARGREGLDGSSLSTLVQMVGAGLGVTLIPEMAVDVETRSANVCVGQFPTPAPGRNLGLVWRKTSPLGDELREVAQLICNARRMAPSV